MGYNLLIQQFVPEPAYAFNHHPLAYLAGGFFPFKAGKVDGVKGGKIHPLPGVAFGIYICQVMFRGGQGLLMGYNGPFSDFYSLKGGSHRTLLL
jgi:hypothetical protein